MTSLLAFAVHARAGRARWQTLAVTLAISAGTLAVAAGGFKAVQYAHASVRQQERFCMPTQDIEVTPLPRWLSCDLVGQVRANSNLPSTLHTLEPNLAEQLAEAFRQHPWVREVVEVRVKHPATVRVKLEYREPVAVIRTAQSLEPIDRDCVLLPAADLHDVRPYLVVSGVKSTPTGPVGSRWDDPAVAAAADVAEALSPHHRPFGLTTLDMTAYKSAGPARAQLYLLTDPGTRVKWGRPPGDDYPGEPTVQDKLDRLSQYIQENGSLDLPAGPYEIDITHWQEITVRPRTPGKTR